MFENRLPSCQANPCDSSSAAIDQTPVIPPLGATLTMAELSPRLRLRANRVARDNGAGIPTSVVIGEDNILLRHVPACYRRRSDGARVSNAYRAKAWSNCYYSDAECVVQIRGSV